MKPLTKRDITDEAVCLCKEVWWCLVLLIILLSNQRFWICDFSGSCVEAY